VSGDPAAARSAPRGPVAPGFSAVADAFADVLAGARGGAAFSVVRDGVPLVELHGGLADPVTGRPWTRDTVAVLFSGTKGLAATACAALADRLDPDAPVVRYWPEFAAGGKATATVAQVLAHTVGLPYVDPEPPAADALDDRACAVALARQTPLWEPGSRVAYHALTWGNLVAELLRRATGGADPRVVLEEVVGRVPGARVFLATAPPEPARIVRAPGYRISTFLDDPRRRRVVERMYRVLLDDADAVNSPGWYRSGALAGAAVAGAPAMARAYAALTDPARSPVRPAALARAVRTHATGTDAVNDRPLRFGLGFELADRLGTFGPEPVAFGHSGAGGGRHGAWPERRIGFSFLTNEMRAEDVDDRADRLLGALHGCLRAA